MKNIWIWNHYAKGMMEQKGGRHYWFAENLIKEGYDVTMFAATSSHNSLENIDTGKEKYVVSNNYEIPTVFVKASSYQGNVKDRIINMGTFYKNLFPTSKEIAKKHGKPDIILASSVHPLTLVAGIQIAKKFSIPCICEVRDLWPESLVAYGMLKENSLLAKMLYKGEKWIYKKADTIVMTWEGGKQYIIDQGWEDELDVNKINHINNGVVLESFDKNALEHQIIDSDLNDEEYKNLVYTGSIRKVNNLGLLLDAAKIIQNKNKEIRFMIYGSGNEKETLKNRCKEENIENVIFKGRVEKKMIPSILKKSYINILHNSSTTLNKYGQSQNKLFEYLASGKCVIQTYTTGYSVLEKYNCGVSVKNQTAEEIAKVILQTCRDEDEVIKMGENARIAAKEFDFGKLTNKLIDIIEEL